MPTSSVVRVLGLDPGLGTTGYGVIEADGSKLRCLAFGAIRTQPGDPVPHRLVRACFPTRVTMAAEWVLPRGCRLRSGRGDPVRPPRRRVWAGTTNQVLCCGIA